MNNNTNSNINSVTVDYLINDSDNKYLLKMYRKIVKGRKFFSLYKLEKILYDVIMVAGCLMVFFVLDKEPMNKRLLYSFSYFITAIILEVLCYSNMVYDDMSELVDSITETFDPLLSASMGLMRITFDREGFTLHGGKYVAAFPYKKVSSITECKKGLFIVMNNDAALLVPARYISPQTAADLRLVLLTSVVNSSMNKRFYTSQAESVSFVPKDYVSDYDVIHYTPTVSEYESSHTKLSTAMDTFETLIYVAFSILFLFIATEKISENVIMPVCAAIALCGMVAIAYVVRMRTVKKESLTLIYGYNDRDGIFIDSKGKQSPEIDLFENEEFCDSNHISTYKVKKDGRKYILPFRVLEDSYESDKIYDPSQQKEENNNTAKGIGILFGWDERKE